MQREASDDLMPSWRFNQAVLNALGLGSLRHVLDLTVTCRGNTLPRIEIGLAVTRGQLDALTAVLERNSFELVLAATDRTKVTAEGRAPLSL